MGGFIWGSGKLINLLFYYEGGIFLVLIYEIIVFVIVCVILLCFWGYFYENKNVF